jgi:uncharacterized protein YkwD
VSRAVFLALVLLFFAPGALAATATERSLARCANELRVSSDLPRLRTASALVRAARLHARNMAREDFFDHDDPQGRGPGERVDIYDRSGRFRAVGENIASAGSASVACRLWERRSGHRRNMLSEDFTAIGTASARGGDGRALFVQVFGG